MKNDQAIGAEAMHIDPASLNEAQYLFKLALAVMEKSDLARATELVRRAAAICPGQGRFWRALGELLSMQNRYAEALAAFERALSVERGSAEIHFSMATALDGLGRKAAAADQFRLSADLAPEWPEAWFNLGVLLLQLSRPEAALGALQKAVDLRPAWIDAWFNLGGAADQMGLSDRAQTCWERVLSLEPEHIQALINLGINHLHKERVAPAEAFFRRALVRDPKAAKAHMHLGLCHQRRKQVAAAEESYRRALEIDPDYAEAWFNLGDALRLLNRWDEVIECYARAAALTPKNAAAHFNLAVALRRKERIGEALISCARARAVDADFPEATAYLLQLAQHACDWDLFEQLAPLVDQLSVSQIVKGQKPSESPMLSLRRQADPEKNLCIAQAWSHWIETGVRSKPGTCCFSHRVRPARHPIRVGYISNDFKEHAVAHHLLGLLRNHNRERFQIHLYACNPEDQSAYRRNLAKACDHFIELDGLSNAAAAQRIYDDGIDILIDLMGHTRGGRLEILAMRPAPVQAAYLGFLGSSGATFIDYFITDRIVTPPDEAACYTEKLVFLPDCYQVNDDHMPITRGANRQACGLNSEQWVLSCFHQAYKIDRRCFQAWLSILIKMPKAVLWLLRPNDTARDHLCRAAAQAGVAAERFIFASPLRIDHHLGRLALADLALDPFLYNGGATTANALWAGVPVLTLAGRHLVSRMSASALISVGLPEMITHSVEEYVQRAVYLLTHPSDLRAIRAKLEQLKTGSSLFDSRRFSRHLEAALEQMMARFDAGMAPASFSIESRQGSRTVLV